MKVQLHKFLLLIIVFGLFNCNKSKLPNEANDSPVFFLKGDLDGSPLNLEAGNSGYLMKTSYQWDTTNVCIFKSDLSQQACNGVCNGYAVTLLMNDSKTSIINSKVNLNTVLRPGDYLFNDMDLPAMYYRINLMPSHSKLSSEKYTWRIQNASGSYFKDEYTTSEIIPSNTVYSITLTYDNGQGCTASHLNVFKASNRLQASIKASRISLPSLANYDFYCDVIGTPPFNYFWDFGDGTTSNLAKPNHSFQPVLNGKACVKLMLVDAAKDTCITYYQAQTSLDPSCDANYTSTLTPLINTKAFSTITLLIKDSKGITYSTKDVVQPSSSYFQVTEIADYLQNTEGLPTKKIKAFVNCVLINGNKQIHLNNAEVCLALAYSN